ERDRAFEHGDMTWLHAHHLIWLEMIFDRIAIQFGKRHAGTGQLLQDETLACKHANAKSARKKDIELDTFLCAQEGMLMHDHGLTSFQLQRQDLAWEIRAERRLTGRTFCGEIDNESGSAGDRALQHATQSA